MPKSVFSDAYALVIERLIELRKAQQVSQVELARRLGKTQRMGIVYRAQGAAAGRGGVLCVRESARRKPRARKSSPSFATMPDEVPI